MQFDLGRSTEVSPLIAARGETPELRLRELLQVLPAVQHLGMWHSQLARHILVEVGESS